MSDDADVEQLLENFQNVLETLDKIGDVESLVTKLDAKNNRKLLKRVKTAASDIHSKVNTIKEKISKAYKRVKLRSNSETDDSTVSETPDNDVSDKDGRNLEELVNTTGRYSPVIVGKNLRTRNSSRLKSKNDKQQEVNANENLCELTEKNKENSNNLSPDSIEKNVDGNEVNKELYTDKEKAEIGNETAEKGDKTKTAEQSADSNDDKDKSKQSGDQDTESEDLIEGTPEKSPKILILSIQKSHSKKDKDESVVEILDSTMEVDPLDDSSIVEIGETTKVDEETKEKDSEVKKGNTTKADEEREEKQDKSKKSKNKKNKHLDKNKTDDAAELNNGDYEKSDGEEEKTADELNTKKSRNKKNKNLDKDKTDDAGVPSGGESEKSDNEEGETTEELNTKKSKNKKNKNLDKEETDDTSAPNCGESEKSDNEEGITTEELNTKKSKNKKNKNLDIDKTDDAGVLNGGESEKSDNEEGETTEELITKKSKNKKNKNLDKDKTDDAGVLNDGESEKLDNEGKKITEDSNTKELGNKRNKNFDRDKIADADKLNDESEKADNEKEKTIEESNAGQEKQTADTAIKEEKDTEESEPLRPMPKIKLVDINKLLAPGTKPMDITPTPTKGRKCVTFDSSVIVLTSSDEDTPRKDPKEEQSTPLKSALRKTSPKVIDLSDSDSKENNENLRNTRSSHKKATTEKKLASDQSSDESDFEVNTRSQRVKKHEKNVKEKFSRLVKERNARQTRNQRRKRDDSSLDEESSKSKRRSKRNKDKKVDTDSEDEEKQEKVSKKSSNKRRKKELLEESSLSEDSSNSDNLGKEVKKSSKSQSPNKKAKASYREPDINDPRYKLDVYIRLPKFKCEELPEIYKRKKELLEVKRLTKVNLSSRRTRQARESGESSDNSDKPESKKIKLTLKLNKTNMEKEDSSDSERSSTEDSDNEHENVKLVERVDLNPVDFLGAVVPTGMEQLAMTCLEQVNEQSENDEHANTEEDKDKDDSETDGETNKKAEKEKTNKKDKDKENEGSEDDSNEDAAKKKTNKKDGDKNKGSDNEDSAENDTTKDTDKTTLKKKKNKEPLLNGNLSDSEEDNKNQKKKRKNKDNDSEEESDELKKKKNKSKVKDSNSEEESDNELKKKKSKSKVKDSNSEEESDNELKKKKNKSKVKDSNSEEESDKEPKKKKNKAKKKADSSSEEESDSKSSRKKQAQKRSALFSSDSISKVDDDSEEDSDKELRKKQKSKRKTKDDSEEDSDKEISKKQKRKQETKRDDSSDEESDNKKGKSKKTVSTESSDCDDDFAKFSKKKDKSKKELVRKAKKKMKKKKVISDSDSDGDGKESKDDSDNGDSEGSSSGSEKEDDSDKDKKKQKSKPSRKRIKRVKDSSSDEEDKSTRKQIRRLIDRDSLSESTKKAEQDEKERKQRILEKQKKYNQIFELQTDSTVDKVVLDFDEKIDKPLLSVHKKIVKHLKPHQVQGVKFMWDAAFESLERVKKGEGSGCILAHCMGLGKTLQVIALTHTLLMSSEDTKVEKVMVVCPVNTVINWKNEFKKWMPHSNDFEVYDLVSVKTSYINQERSHIVKCWHEEGGVLIIGYTMFRTLSNPDNKTVSKKLRATFQKGLVDPGPDLVICDEGHLLKNEKTHLSIAMNRIKTPRRIVLTGTPLQNNLREYWCMVQFIKPNLLGTYKEYMNRFVNPITNGQYTDSTQHDIMIMRRRSHVLHKLLDGVVQRQDYAVLAPYLPPKYEYVLFLKLTEVQVKLYRHYMDHFARRNDVANKTSFLFTDFQQLQRICTHPRVLLQKSIEDKDKIVDESESEGSLKDFIDDDGSDTASSSNNESGSGSDSDKGSDSDASAKSKNKKKNTAPRRGTRLTRAQAAQKGEDSDVSDEVEEIEEKHWWEEYISKDELDNINHSAKIFLLFQILKECEEIGDKILVFSQSLYALNCIEYFLAKIDEATQQGNAEKVGGHTGSWAIGLDYFRLDGKSSCDNRANWCDQFNDPDNTRARLFLISTKAGGLGINLVAANRVIIFDVSWNPSHDIQSIYRVYRFGQTKPSYIYRFVTYGAMESKIYERQVTKQAISKRVIDEQQIDRHYSQNDIQELYRSDIEPTDRPIPMVPKDVLLGEMLQKYEDTIFQYHEHQSLLENKQDEELNEEERKAAWEEFENEKVVRKTTITNFGGINLGAITNSALNFSPQLIQLALGNIVRKDNPTWSDVQIKGILPALVTQLQVQMSENDFSMYNRVQQEIRLMQALQQQRMRENYLKQFQMQQMLQKQQLANQMMGNLNITPQDLRRIQMAQASQNYVLPTAASSLAGGSNDIIELND